MIQEAQANDTTAEVRTKVLMTICCVRLSSMPPLVSGIVAASASIVSIDIVELLVIVEFIYLLDLGEERQPPCG